MLIMRTSLLSWALFLFLTPTLAHAIRHDPIIAFLAELGVIVLPLQIGLETRLADLVQVGGRATAVEIIGIITPFVLGAFLVGPWPLPGLSWNTYLFLGAALSATSVGITGRLFRDLGKLNLPATRIVLGSGDRRRARPGHPGYSDNPPYPTDPLLATAQKG
jgi:Kef-type K+ transport system membrane component KefB